MPPIIQTQPVMFTVKDLLHTLNTPVSAPRTPFTGRRVHFVGVGGSGMSGLAHMLLNFGALVSGTDRTASAATRRLAEIGASIGYEQNGDSVPDGTEIVVHSAAIGPQHPEMIAARAKRCEILKYAQMLGKVMSLKRGIAIAGTHGKSTTTAMTAHVLLAAGKDPSYVVGATCEQLGGSARSGAGELFVVEACEYDRSFHNLRPHIGAALNIEEDHLDYYTKGIDEIVESFTHFLGQIDPNGLALISAIDPNCATAAKNIEARVETYGIDTAADWQATGIRRYQGKAHFQVVYKGKKMGRLVLGLPGRHNVGTATVAAAIATHCGLTWEQIQSAVETFRGADRRSQRLGQFPHPEFPGDLNVTIIDDYGHHPTEVRATLRGAREGFAGRIIVAFQPHRYTRTQLLLDEFAGAFDDADLLFVTDIYAAGEAPIPGVGAQKVCEAITAHGHRGARCVPSRAKVAAALAEAVREGDMIITLGAGDIWKTGMELLSLLKAGRRDT